MKAVVATLFSIRKPERLFQRDMLSSMKSSSGRVNLSKIETGQYHLSRIQMSETEVEATGEIEMVSPDILQSNNSHRVKIQFSNNRI